MACSVMNRAVISLILLLGLGAQPALACTGGEADVPPFRTVASDSAPAAVEPDRLAGEQRCDCSAHDDSAQAAVIETEKTFLFALSGGFPAATDSSFAERCRVLDAGNRLHSAAFPALHLPLYLLTARLRC